MSKATQILHFFESCKLRAYQDTAGIWTVGWGSTKNVKPEMEITQEEADNRLLEDIQDAKNRIKIYVKIPLLEHEEAAMLSLAFNLRSFGKLASYVNTSKDLFKSKMLLYCKDVKGNYLRGLKIRRISERLLFENREWEAIAEDLQRKNIEEVLIKEKELFPGA